MIVLSSNPVEFPLASKPRCDSGESWTADQHDEAETVLESANRWVSANDQAQKAMDSKISLFIVQFKVGA